VPRSARTAKKLAQRIDLRYFQRPHALRRWRFLLSLTVPAVALLWIAWAGAAHNRQIYSSGSMASPHAVFAAKCETCHVSRAGEFRRLPEDRACLTCHDGPIHHANQIFTPSCADCHREHQGRIQLKKTTDSACTQCHTDLQTRTQATAFNTHVEGFSTRHPEFAVLRSGYKDPGTIKLNHSVHMKAGLRTKDGHLVQLACADCHRTPASREAWPYGTPQLQMAAVLTGQGSLTAAPNRAYLAPPEYAKACASCHALSFDQRFADPVPHDTPEIVHAFVLKRFEDYIARHPEELRVSQTVRLPEKGIPPSPKIFTPREWVQDHVADAERLLWRKTCKECHTLGFSTDAALPHVAKSGITVRWLPHAVFDHSSHTMAACASCHASVLTSRETSDVLIPGIETCRQCHRSGAEAAEARCSECHTYHDWTQRKEVQAPYLIPELLHGTSSPPQDRAPTWK
jgi:predicted CXXCH cytochrome family protein